ncbi:zinc-dependent metalloprotease [Arthrobacter sp. zg-ZUI100]|uniref:Zinc-dependent metalloprotease n=1 Tax=Arthrobacter jiangjiafuii TaxID=2817475 RepID=A0A975M3K3_9MICC|nr:zinc-dependent metalloprotease [Arthrobacter jiangjiafuii]MBP3034852.1 zinc-dependent metalloprotease [Arthrobacter jiangjiafuii]MBP3044568.1 zinc-dependent metalloprotease [Arthrobacter jiangjiafuii]QWC09328.1 zinc-dependent metalloprotease [Arthrobacter jiangjiafuii]
MSSNPSDSGDNPQDPLSEMLAKLFGGAGAGGMDPQELAKAAGLPSDPNAMAMMMQQVQAMFTASSEGPVNWQLAKDNARRVAATDSDPSVQPAQSREVDEALRLAQLWLDPVTDFATTSALGKAWSRAEWVEATMDSWKRLTEPVAVSISQALSNAITTQLPEEMKAMMGGASSMLANMGGAMFGIQLGQAVGALSKEVVSSTDIGLPLAGGTMALLPANVAKFGEGLDIPEAEIRLYLAVREAAHASLFANAPWLSSHLFGTIESYARGIHIDVSKIEEVARDLDPSNPESIQEALSGGVFQPERTPAQSAALERLETALALVEGWVDEVTAAATVNLPSAGALREMIRRRRASGGPAEHTFSSLVGLELRPRRLRDAAALWSQLREERGIEGRDAVWEHPDLMPTSKDLDDPKGFSKRRELLEASDSDVDAALTRLLNGDFDTPEPDADSSDSSDNSDSSDTTPGEGNDPGDNGKDDDGDAPEGGRPQA